MVAHPPKHNNCRNKLTNSIVRPFHSLVIITIRFWLVHTPCGCPLMLILCVYTFLSTFGSAYLTKLDVLITVCVYSNISSCL